MECATLARTIQQIQSSFQAKSILEVGCGNGHNCFFVAEQFPGLPVTGVDYIPKMVESARQIKKEKGLPDERVQFLEGDILNLQLPNKQYDIIFTNRCIINLNTDELQARAVANLSKYLPKGGYLIMIENSQLTHGKQNHARTLLDLPARPVAEFNHFINEDSFRKAIHDSHLELVKTEDFLGLHDLVLYVLVPAINGGEIDYGHPLVEAATRLNINMAAEYPSSFGDYGQSRVYLCRKE